MSDRVAWTRGRACRASRWPGSDLLLLSGCSSDVTRFSASKAGNPFSNPFAEQDGGRGADAGRNRRADGARRRPGGRGDADRIRRPQAAAGGRVGCRLDGRGRLADRGRRGRDAGYRSRPVTACLPPRFFRPTVFPAARRSRAGCASSCPSITRTATALRAPRPPKRRRSAPSEVADAGAKRPRRRRRTKEEQKTSPRPTSRAEGEKSASKNDAGAAVAYAEPCQAAETKTPAIDKAPTGDVEPARRKRRSRSPARKADAEGVEPEFRWPARGRIIQGFKSGGNDGINISVPAGTSVRAAEAGVVVYSGDGLKGYGNLVLIKHPNGFVTAYGNNGELDVKRGEQVKRGQVDRQVRRHRQRQLAATPFRTAQGIDPGRSDQLSRRPLNRAGRD